MKKAIVIISLSLILALGTVTPFFKVGRVYAQEANQKQRLGTSNILEFPYVNVVSDTGKTTLLDLEFVLSGNNTAATNSTNPAIQRGSNSSTVVAFKNLDYGLNNSTNTPKLSIGQSFRINSTNSGDIPYSKVNVKLVSILSGTDPTAEDPEDMMLGQPISLGSYIGNFGNFSIPHVTQPGKYILYAYVQYPLLHATGIYNGQVILIQKQQQPTTTTASSMPTTNPQMTGGEKIITSTINNTGNTAANVTNANTRSRQD